MKITVNPKTFWDEMGALDKLSLNAPHSPKKTIDIELVAHLEGQEVYLDDSIPYEPGKIIAAIHY